MALPLFYAELSGRCVSTAAAILSWNRSSSAVSLKLLSAPAGDWQAGHFKGGLHHSFAECILKRKTLSEWQ